MNARIFTETMNEISDNYIMESVNYHPKHKNQKDKKTKSRKRNRSKSVRITWGATAAACLVIVSLTAFACRTILEDSLSFEVISPNPSGTTPDTQGNVSGTAANTQGNSSDGTDKTENGTIICMRDVFINEIKSFVSDARLYYDPAQYDMVDWDATDILAYYGKDLTPAYIPEGLTAAPGNETAAVVIGKDQTMKQDSVSMGFYHAYYEDGSPMLTEGVAACKGFSLTVSKIGLIKDCYYILPENEVQISDIGGTAVTFGYRSMPYGPYDAQTHEPSGYYDLYAAEFEFEGIEYEIITEQLAKEEIVKIVGSIIYQDKEVQIES